MKKFQFSRNSRAIFASFTFGLSLGISINVYVWPTDKAVVSAPKVDLSGNSLSGSEGIDKYGLPLPISNIIHRNSYSLSFNKQTRNADWTLERLHKNTEQIDNVKESNLIPYKLFEDHGIDRPDRRKSHFKEDSEVPAMFRTTLKDYFQSGYDRGHLVPAGDSNNQEDMNDTFFLSNISPQIGLGFNRGYWKCLEGWIRELKPVFEDVYVVTGPLYLRKTGQKKIIIDVLSESILIPSHFYKVLLAKKKDSEELFLAAFVLPNSRINNGRPLQDFEVPLDSIERSSGLKFFPKLDTDFISPLCEQIECSIAAQVAKEIRFAKKKELKV